MDLKRSLGLRERRQPRRPTRPSMVMPRARCVHAERAIDARRPGFPQPLSLFLSPVLRAAPCHPGRAPGVASELGNQLRPDGDHPDEKCDRRQRRRLFHEYLQHAYLLIRNIRRTLFLFCSNLSSVVVAQFEKCPLWLILDRRAAFRNSGEERVMQLPVSMPGKINRCDLVRAWGVWGGS
jgi:hypothetical protein